MNRINLFTVGLIFALPAAAFANDLRDAGAVLETLSSAGYTEVREIELDDGLWEAKVRRADGRWGEIHIDPATKEIFDGNAGVSILDAAAIATSLAGAGYTAIEDLDRDGAIWDVDATDSAGQRVELRVSGHDGRVLSSDVDWDD